MESKFIFWHYFNIKCSSVQFHYDQVSTLPVTSVNLIWKKCPIHPEFLDTDFWLFDYHMKKIAAPLFYNSVQNFDLPLPHTATDPIARCASIAAFMSILYKKSL